MAEKSILDTEQEYELHRKNSQQGDHYRPTNSIGEENSVIDQFIDGCEGNSKLKFFDKLKSFSILSPPQNNVTEAKADELSNLLCNKISASCLLSEISVLKEEEKGGEPMAYTY